MHPLRSLLLVTALPATLLLLSGCGAPAAPVPDAEVAARASASATPAPNTDPRAGWVVLEETLYTSLRKRCDGTALLYVVRGSDSGQDLEVVPDSAECAELR